MPPVLSKWLAWLIAGTLLLLSLIYLSHIWVYVIVSIIIAFIGNPVVIWLCSRRIFGLQINRSLAALTALMLVFGFLGGILWLIIPMVAEQALLLGSIDHELVLQNLEIQLSQLSVQLKQLGMWPEGDQWEELSDKALNLVSMQQLGSYFGGALSFTLNIIIGLFATLFISFYMLKESGMVGRVIKAFTPDENLGQMQEAIGETRRLLTRYFVGLLFQILAVATLIALGLSILGVEYALTLGVLAGLFNLIPYIGPYIGGSFGVFIALSAELAVGSDVALLPYALKIMSVFVATQLIDNFVFQPVIFSKSVQAHPLEIFLVILIAGSLFGIVGMLAAIPVYTIFRVLAKAFFAQSKWVQKLTARM